MRKLLALSALLAAAVLSARAQEAPAAAGLDAEGAAELAQFRLQVELTSERVEGLLSRLAGLLGPQERALAERTFRNAFKAEAMYEDGAAYLRRQVADPSVRNSLAKLDVALVRRMVSLEVEATRPEHRGKLGEYAQRLDPESAPVRRRLQLLGRLDEATRTSEHLADLNIGFANSFYVSLAALSPPGKRPSEDELGRTMRQTEAKLKEDFEGAGVVLFLYAFRSVTDAEIERYVKMCEAEEGRRFSALRWGALAEAYARAGERFGAELSKAVSR